MATAFVNPLYYLPPDDPGLNILIIIVGTILSTLTLGFLVYIIYNWYCRPNPHNDDSDNNDSILSDHPRLELVDWFPAPPPLAYLPRSMGTG
jgi:hypothetical protein